MAIWKTSFPFLDFKSCYSDRNKTLDRKLLHVQLLQKVEMTSKNVKRASWRLYIYINTHSPSFNITLPPSVWLSVCLAHPPTDPLGLIPSMVVCPLLIFRGQGRDVHPQLLVSQRQMQELRLDNQLRTSIHLLVIGGFTHFDGQVHNQITWLVM